MEPWRGMGEPRDDEPKSGVAARARCARAPRRSLVSRSPEAVRERAVGGCRRPELLGPEEEEET